MKLTKTLDILKQYAEEVIRLYQDKIRNKQDSRGYTTNSTGDLAQHITYEIRQTDEKVDVVLNLEDYFEYVENGTRPHFPPPSAIEKWIVEKPILPRPDKNGKLPTIPQLAFMICAKINREGTQPHPYLKESIDELTPKYEELLTQSLIDDAVDIIYEDFNKLFINTVR